MVSEIMLQQTRVEAVIPYYLRWMKSFPDVHSLAAATEDEVNSHWAGLGFYRRARLLHAGAKKVVMDYGGVLPNNIEGLLKIDGGWPLHCGGHRQHRLRQGGPSRRRQRVPSPVPPDRGGQPHKGTCPQGRGVRVGLGPADRAGW